MQQADLKFKDHPIVLGVDGQGYRHMAEGTRLRLLVPIGLGRCSPYPLPIT